MDSVRWYEPTEYSEEDDERLRADALIAETKNVEDYQQSLAELNLWNATLYSNRELVGFNWGVLENASRELWPTNLHTENLIEEVGDAMLSKASSSPLRPTLIPHGNSWKIERAVRLADKFLAGVWHQTESEDACVRAYLDAFISSIGCVQDVYDEKTNTLHTEPVFFDSVVIDNRECINRQMPRTYRIRKVKPRSAIESANPGKRLAKSKKYVDWRRVGEGWEVVVEAWRLPDADGKGGRHTVACCGCLLVDEEWNEDWVPLEFFHWKDRLSGFYTQSGVEQLVPYQVRQNELNDAIRESQDIVCRPRMWKHANSQINLDEWDNTAGRFMTYAGNKPEPMQWPTQLQELYQERERNSSKAFSHVGQSEMFAHADIPQQVRLDSSAGVREFRNMEDSRHLRSWTRFEAFRLRVAKMHLKVLARHKGATAYSAVYHPARANARAQSITFQAIKKLTADNFSWTLEAVPASQQSAAARRELIRDAQSRGATGDEYSRQIYSNPNLEWLEDAEQAGIDDIRRHIEVLEEGEYEAPTRITNLTAGIHLVTANIHRLRTFDDVPAETIENHLMWIAAATTIMTQATQPPPQQPGIAFAPTQGLPGTSAAMAPAPRTLIQSGDNSVFGR